MIQTALLIALIVLFVHSTMWKGEIFGFVREAISPKKKISEPIYNCPICMTPWWGTLFYILLFGWNGWQHWVITIGAAAGFNVFSVIGIYIKDFCKANTPE